MLQVKVSLTNDFVFEKDVETIHFADGFLHMKIKDEAGHHILSYPAHIIRYITQREVR